MENGILSMKWEFKADGPISGAVVGTDEMILFNTMNGSLYALERNSGELIFKRQVPGELYNSPFLDEERNRVVVATSKGEVISFSMDAGEKEWNTTVGDDSAIHSSPNGYGDAIVVTSYDSNLYVLDTESGEVLWSFKGCGSQIHTTPSFYFDGGITITVMFGACDGYLYSLDLVMGELYWNFSADYIPSSPAVHEDSVFFGSFDENFYSVDADDGELLWSTPLGGPIFSSPSVSGSYVAVSSDDGLLHLLDAGSGDVLWNVSVESSLSTSPVIMGDHVLLTYDDGLAIYSIMNGTRTGGFELGEASETSPSVISDMIFFGDNIGYVHAISAVVPEDTEPMDMGEEDDPVRDIIVILIGVVLISIVGIALYIGYVRIREDE